MAKLNGSDLVDLLSKSGDSAFWFPDKDNQRKRNDWQAKVNGEAEVANYRANSVWRSSEGERRAFNKGYHNTVRKIAEDEIVFKQLRSSTGRPYND